jgi:hypothetical protein
MIPPTPTFFVGNAMSRPRSRNNDTKMSLCIRLAREIVFI